ncbi:hypothetical protein CRE_11293 [Caenorhabditis remanei]|uniref:Uncharacterized protein n=1 Tax=Caenorhabditis remanei TaxID=31234 RepID=E3N0D7_CAERE|nr:hypothetical protein CRE_11293 [Caenorhabditis remanei]
MTSSSFTSGAPPRPPTNNTTGYHTGEPSTFEDVPAAGESDAPDPPINNDLISIRRQSSDTMDNAFVNPPSADMSTPFDPTSMTPRKMRQPRRSSEMRRKRPRIEDSGGDGNTEVTTNESVWYESLELYEKNAGPDQLYDGQHKVHKDTSFLEKDVSLHSHSKRTKYNFQFLQWNRHSKHSHFPDAVRRRPVLPDILRLGRECGQNQKCNGLRELDGTVENK